VSEVVDFLSHPDRYARAGAVGPRWVLMARATPGFAGADLANLINEAAIVAIRDNRDVIYAPTSTRRGIASCSVAVMGPMRPPRRSRLLRSTKQGTRLSSLSCLNTPIRWPRSRSCLPAGHSA
jgi:ATP-dependent Zn protease